VPRADRQQSPINSSIRVKLCHVHGAPDQHA